MSNLKENCVFCKIINGEIKSDILYEDENFIIIKDINPISPYHYLAIVKNHYGLISEQSKADISIFSEVLNKISHISNKLGLENGFRLIVNQGSDAGQTVQHLHVHVLGGKPLKWDNL